MNVLTLADGRDLAYDVVGDPDGLPVVFSHGFSDSRLIRNPDEALTAALGVWLITADQPGVGGSSPKRDRRMVDWGDDMEQLADELGLGSFAVAGHSGGGPHALAVAARLPDRVTHGVLASPVGPFDREDFADMVVLRDLKLVLRLRRLRPVLRWAYRAEARRARKDMAAWLEASAEGDPSDADTLLADPDQRAMFEANFTAGLAQGGEGVYEMTMALWDWGFELADVTQHFEVFYGDADDIVSSRMPARVAELLPDATAHVWPGVGHYGFVDRPRWTEFLGSLVTEGRRSDSSA